MNKPTQKQCLQDIHSTEFIVDTTFLIDASKSLLFEKEASPYKEFLSLLVEKNIKLVTVQPVMTEFFKGANLLSDWRKKRDFFEEIIYWTLPLDPDIQTNIYRLTPLYRDKGSSVSFTDFTLGASSMKYRNAYILTRDHGDFTTKIFDRITVVPFQHNEGTVDLYGLFRASDMKIAKVQAELLEIDKKSRK